jgi:hypothetical protein
MREPAFLLKKKARKSGPKKAQTKVSAKKRLLAVGHLAVILNAKSDCTAKRSADGRNQYKFEGSHVISR